MKLTFFCPLWGSEELEKEAFFRKVKDAGYDGVEMSLPPDPRVPEWQEALQIHLEWWKKIIKNNQEAGRKVFTITTEFGPYPYMPILPFSRQPLTCQWDVNVFMKDFLKKRIGIKRRQKTEDRRQETIVELF